MSRAHTPAMTGGKAMPDRWSVSLVLTIVALFVHGYHPFAEDAGIYIPAIKKQLDPTLYPHSSEFFLLPAHWSVFTHVIAGTAKLTHLPLSYVVLFWYLACLFFTIAACWKIAEISFAKWSAGFIGALLAAVTISMPAAGSALLLFDPYLTSRSFSTPLLLFSVAFLIERRHIASALCWSTALVFHPLMAAVGGMFLVLLLAARSARRARYIAEISMWVVLASVVVASIMHTPVSEEYRSAVSTRSYFFLSQWAWYELLGAVAPLLIFSWMAWSRRNQRGSVQFQLSVAAVAFGSLAILGALEIMWIPILFAFARFQPMRALQLIYILLILLPINAEIQRIATAWPTALKELALATLLICLGGGMYLVQRETFPASSHIEWPWIKAKNPWQQAFEWIRQNTPKDAVFALDPNYPNDAGDDHQGFRAIAERSALPDRAKDGGVAALFPQVAQQWDAAVVLTATVNRMDEAERTRLLQAGATWVVMTSEAPRLDCPYSNREVSVCRLIPAPYTARLKSTP